MLTSDSVYQIDPHRGMLAINKIDDPDIKKPQFNREKGLGVRWERTDVAQVLAQDDKYTYVVRKDNVIAALDKKSGEAQFTSRRKDFAAYASNPKDGTVYAATKGGRIVSIKPVLTPGQAGELVMERIREGAKETPAVARSVDTGTGPAAAPARVAEAATSHPAKGK